MLDLSIQEIEKVPDAEPMCWTGTNQNNGGTH